MERILMIAGLAVALVSEVFPGFSDFIMRGLAQAPAFHGAAGMVGVNCTVYRSVFMILFRGVVPVSGTPGLLALWTFEGTARALAWAGAAACLIGVLPLPIWAMFR